MGPPPGTSYEQVTEELAVAGPGGELVELPAPLEAEVPVWKRPPVLIGGAVALFLVLARMRKKPNGK